MKHQKDAFEVEIKKFVEKEKQKKVDIKVSSKSLPELVVTERFVIEEVISESYATSFTPISEMMFGGKSPLYVGGYASRLVLKVKPENSKVPVKTLYFDGFSVVKAGDYISAQIPRYKEEKMETGSYLWPQNVSEVIYTDRSFNQEESAIELAVLSKDGNVLRRDRSINYKSFVKR